jgi:hypothetical protein
MTEQTYIKRDLIDYVDGDIGTVLEDPDAEWEFDRYPRNRVDAVKNVLPEEATVHSTWSGSYSGEYVLCIELDGYIWIRHGYYGSCSVCDAYENDPVAETERICRGAYCFESVDDARTYLDTSVDYGWEENQMREQARGLLDDLEESR